MGRLGTSWDLAKASFGVIGQDKELLLFPLISGLVIIAMLVSIFTTLFFTGGFRLILDAVGGSQPVWGEVVVALVVFSFYLLAHFVAVYFNCALVGAAMVRLNGRDPTLGDGIRAANAHLGRILLWAVIGGTVGYLLRAARQRAGLLGKIAVAIVGAAWGVATFFVIPVLVFEDVGPIQAVRRSLSLFRSTWVETLVGPLALGLIFLALGLLGLVPLLVGFIIGGTPAIIAGAAIMLVYWVGLAILASATQGVLVAALYRYATTRQVPPGFDRGQMTNPFLPKSGGLAQNVGPRTFYP